MNTEGGDDTGKGESAQLVIYAAHLSLHLKEPLLEQGFQLAHVGEAQVQSLEPRDGRLAEVHAHRDLADRVPHVPLREPQGRAASFEVHCEPFQLLQVYRHSA